VFDVEGNPLVDILKDTQGCLKTMANIGDIMKVRFPRESNK